MKARGTLVMAAILAVLCVGYWAMLKMEQREREEEFEAMRLFKFEPQDVASITVRRLGEQPVTGARQQGALWRIEKPYPAIEPNIVVWDRMAAALAYLLNSRTIEEKPGDLSQYGLDKPVLTINATTFDGTAVQLNFGTIEATQSFRYASLEDGPIFLIDSRYFGELDRPLDLLRYPYVVNVGPDGVRRVEYARYWSGVNGPANPERNAGDESVVVVVDRQADGRWKLVSPIMAEANAEMVDAFVNEVQFATGRNYVDAPANLKDYGLDPPKARITLYSGNQSPQTLLLGSIESNDPKIGGGVFARNADKPSVFVMSPEVLTLLPKTPDAFRESRLLPCSPTDIMSVQYTLGQDSFSLAQQEKAGWAITQPPTQDSDQIAISNFLAFLKALEGEQFPPEVRPEFGFDKPYMTLTFTVKDRQEPLQIVVGAEVPETGRRYVLQPNGAPTVISSLAVRGLTKSVHDFRRLALMEFPREQATKITVEFEGKRYVFERPRGPWSLTEPEDYTVTSASDVDALLRAICNVRASEVETPAVPASLEPYGLDNPLLIITVEARPGTDPERRVFGPLKIGAVSQSDSHGRYAVCDQLAGVYRVRQALVDEVRESLKGVQPL